MSKWDDNAIYEEEIGLTATEGGSTFIEDDARDLPQPQPTAAVLIRCHECGHRQTVAYLRGAYTDETRFRFRHALISVRRWRSLTGRRTFITTQYCPECNRPTPWRARGVEPITKPGEPPVSSEGPD